jgi:hypothetical protein
MHMTGLALGAIGLAPTGTLLAPALFPFLALGTLPFLDWEAAFVVALLRSTRSGSSTPPRVGAAN